MLFQQKIKQAYERCKMLEQCKELNERHISFLKKQGLEPKEFLHLETSAYHYKFYHIRTAKEVVIRR